MTGSPLGVGFGSTPPTLPVASRLQLFSVPVSALALSSTVSVQVPSNAVSPLYQLGIELSTNGTWTGTVHGLFAELGVGASTASALELATALSAMLAGFGLVFLLLGGGLVWVAWPAKEAIASA